MDRLGRVWFHFLTQLRDMHVHGARCRIGATTPDCVKQLFSGEDAVRVLQQKRQELELPGREPNPTAAPGQFHPGEIKTNFPEGNHCPRKIVLVTQASPANEWQHIDRLPTRKIQTFVLSVLQQDNFVPACRPGVLLRPQAASSRPGSMPSSGMRT